MSRTTIYDYTRTTMPDCSGQKAFILDGAFYGGVVALMAAAGFEQAKTIEESDVVVFIGGADINPKLYGEEHLPCTSFSNHRDSREVLAYENAKLNKKPMFGICRGAQFLHAMNGGKLWQDVNNHGGRSHWIIDLETDCRVLATSMHHQMLQHNDKMSVMAVCEDQISTFYEDAKDVLNLPQGTPEEDLPMEIEAGAYLDTGCFFVQGHPECGTPEYRAWTMRKLDNFLIDWEQHLDDMNKIDGVDEEEPAADPAPTLTPAIA